MAVWKLLEIKMRFGTEKTALIGKVLQFLKAKTPHRVEIPLSSIQKSKKNPRTLEKIKNLHE